VDTPLHPQTPLISEVPHNRGCLQNDLSTRRHSHDLVDRGPAGLLRACPRASRVAHPCPAAAPADDPNQKPEKRPLTSLGASFLAAQPSAITARCRAVRKSKFAPRWEANCSCSGDGPTASRPTARVASRRRDQLRRPATAGCRPGPSRPGKPWPTAQTSRAVLARRACSWPPTRQGGPRCRSWQLFGGRMYARGPAGHRRRGSVEHPDRSSIARRVRHPPAAPRGRWCLSRPARSRSRAQPGWHPKAPLRAGNLSPPPAQHQQRSRFRGPSR